MMSCQPCLNQLVIIFRYSHGLHDDLDIDSEMTQEFALFLFLLGIQRVWICGL